MEDRYFIIFYLHKESHSMSEQVPQWLAYQTNGSFPNNQQVLQFIDDTYGYFRSSITSILELSYTDLMNWTGESVEPVMKKVMCDICSHSWEVNIQYELGRITCPKCNLSTTYEDI